MRPVIAAVALLGLLALSAGNCAADPGPCYTVVPLHPLAGTETEDTVICEPHALNNKGECVGMAEVSGHFHVVRWDSQAEPHILGKPSDRLTDVWGINDRGQAIAYASGPGPTMAARLFLVDAQGAHLLTPPAGTETMGFIGGVALNNAGQVAFNTQPTGSLPLPIRAFLYDHGTLTDLGHLPLRSFEARSCDVSVHALNNSGMAAGQSQISLKDADGLPLLPVHAFLWRKGVMTDLGVPPGYDESSATALNDRGDVIGTIDRQSETQSGPDPASQDHGFLWRKGVMTDLGTLPGCRYTEPTGINNQGQIVGNSYNIEGSGNSFSRTGGALNGGVFLWQDGKMQDLQTLVPAGWQLQSAVSINDRGDILCTGSHDGMPSRALGSGAFLLRPFPNNPSPK